VLASSLEKKAESSQKLFKAQIGAKLITVKKAIIEVLAESKNGLSLA
jgi:hypothetical protein